ncbi:hypothetical protein TNCV_4702301 [Trichonephila clavipes]|nr:hypothetical protein TNCV_4702301 [Trichonephila clavipes]
MARLQFVRYSWRIRRRIVRTDDGGKKPNRLAASRALLVLKLLRTQSLPFQQQCRVRSSFKHGRPARARSSNFLVSLKRLTSFKRPAGVKGLFHSSHFLNSEFT